MYEFRKEGSVFVYVRCGPFLRYFCRVSVFPVDFYYLPCFYELYISFIFHLFLFFQKWQKMSVLDGFVLPDDETGRQNCSFFVYSCSWQFSAYFSRQRRGKYKPSETLSEQSIASTIPDWLWHFQWPWINFSEYQVHITLAAIVRESSVQVRSLTTGIRQNTGRIHHNLHWTIRVEIT